MNLECLREKIRAAVSTAERVTGKNLSLPILSNLVLEAKERMLKIRATNLDLGLEINLPCKVNQEGAVAVNGATISSFFNNLPASEDKIKLAVKAGNLILSSPTHISTITGCPVEEFPLIPTIINPYSFTVNPQELISDLKKVWYSASFSNLKPEIAGVCFYQQNDGLYLVATDSFRLAEKKFSDSKLKLELSHFIIPLRNIIEITKILENITTELEVKYNQHQISFLSERFHLTSRLIDGIFPDYRQIIPGRHETEVVVAKNNLLDYLKLANVFTDKFNQADLAVKIKQKKLELGTKNDGGNNVSQLSAVSANGPDVSLSLNLKYLLEGLQVITQENVILRFNGEDKPLVVKGAGDDSFTYLIMPIRR